MCKKDGYSVRAKCNLCGGQGTIELEDAAKQWLGAKFVHNDRNLCAKTLKEQKEELLKKQGN